MTCGEKRGTLAGATRHRRNWERPCDDCRKAQSEHQAKRRREDPEAAERNRENSRRRTRAIRRLILRHRAEYAELLREEIR